MRCILFSPSPLTTYFISWPVCDTAIHSPRPTRSTYILFAPAQPFIQPWNLYRFVGKKGPQRLSLGAGLIVHMQAALYGCTVVSPLI